MANGFASMLGCMLGNPFPVTVYVGHAGWKAMGASIGYTLASGITMFWYRCLAGRVYARHYSDDCDSADSGVYRRGDRQPVVRETPKVEVPVIFICLFPWIANWALTIVNSVMGAAGTSAGKLGSDLLHSKGVYYDGLVHLGSGAPLASMLWGCVAIFAIMNKPLRGAIAAAFGALLSLFGVIHSPAVGFAEGSSMMFVVAYLMMSGMFVLKHVLDSREAVTAPEQEPTKTT